MSIELLQKATPNILTSFRCLSALIIPLLVIYGDEIGARLAPMIFIIAGITDYFESAGIPCIGPLKYYAQIETSKIFARNFIDSINLSHHSPNYILIDNHLLS